jgi:serine/threonine protein kinase
MPLYECDLYGWASKYETTDKIMIGFYRQIAMGLQYIHASGIIHADIKPNNILIRGREAVITDFGIAVPGGNNRFRHRRVQTEYYRAPEVATKRYSYPIDCWSLGILIAEISFEKTKLPAGVRPEDIGLPNTVLGRVCAGLLIHAPEKRFTAARTANILSSASRKSHNNYVPAPIIEVPINELPILKGDDDDNLDPDIMRFANKLYEAGGCKKNLRRACYYLTACVYNFAFEYNLDAKTAGQIMPGLHFSQR